MQAKKREEKHDRKENKLNDYTLFVGDDTGLLKKVDMSVLVKPPAVVEEEWPEDREERKERKKEEDRKK